MLASARARQTRQVLLNDNLALRWTDHLPTGKVTTAGQKGGKTEERQESDIIQVWDYLGHVQAGYQTTVGFYY